MNLKILKFTFVFVWFYNFYKNGSLSNRVGEFLSDFSWKNVAGLLREIPIFSKLFYGC